MSPEVDITVGEHRSTMDTRDQSNQYCIWKFGNLKKIKFLCVALKSGEHETGAAGGHLACEEEKGGLEHEAKPRAE